MSFAVQPKTDCPHIPELAEVSEIQAKEWIDSPCDVYDNKAENWICLHCLHVKCSSDSYVAHPNLNATLKAFQEAKFKEKEDQVVPEIQTSKNHSSDSESEEGGEMPSMQDFMKLLMSGGRQRKEDVCTLDHAIELLKKSERIVLVCGAGVSTSCGIPDFRSETGIYARLKRENPELSDPSDMFNIHKFREDPQIFYNFSKEIYVSNFMPSVTHKFISLLEQKGKLLRDYTQNIDTLEAKAGVQNVVFCHGSYSVAHCQQCNKEYPGDSLADNIEQQKVPYCTACGKEEDGSPGVIKPDIVFFGEQLPPVFAESLEKDKNEADLLIVIGSSLKVAPVSRIPELVPADIPQILINRELVGGSHNFDIELLGNCDDVVLELCKRLEWDLPVSEEKDTKEAEFIEPNRYIFEGGVIPKEEDQMPEGIPMDMLQQIFARLM